MKISLATARRIALNCQLLDRRTRLPSGKEGVARTIELLGYVQVDTIAVIQRAHHHTLWTRRPDFQPDMLLDLQAKDRRVFEYWGHALSYLPMSDYRFYLPKMKAFHDPYSKWEKERFAKYGHLMKPVLERIKNEGPLSSKDFLEKTGKKAATPRDRNPSRVALEMLFWRGELMITQRRKFERVYDLTERVLPAGTDTSPPADKELGRFLVLRALQAYGLATETEIRQHIHAADNGVVTAALKEMVAGGEVIPVTIAGIKDQEYYALPQIMKSGSKLRKTKPRLHILSPFDNLIIQRDRVSALFGFNYALECYVTPSKRKHGYFVLPVLYGEELVARFDPRVDRKTNTLFVDRLLFERECDRRDELLPALAGQLRTMAAFNDCSNVRVGTATPVGVGKTLAALLT